MTDIKKTMTGYFNKAAQGLAKASEMFLVWPKKRLEHMYAHENEERAYIYADSRWTEFASVTAQAAGLGVGLYTAQQFGVNDMNLAVEAMGVAAGYQAGNLAFYTGYRVCNPKPQQQEPN